MQVHANSATRQALKAGCFEDNIDIHGDGDFSEMKLGIKTSKQCQTKCRELAEEKCHFWTYWKAGKTCFLNTGSTITRLESAGAVSGLRSCQ